MEQTKQEQAKKLQALMSDEDIIKQLQAAQSVADVQAVMAKSGLNVSLEDTNAIIAAVVAPEDEGELSDESLEQTSGGSVVGLAWGALNLTDAELAEFCKEGELALEQSELDEEVLEVVSGGSLTLAGITALCKGTLVVCGGLYTAGLLVAIGICVYAYKKSRR